MTNRDLNLIQGFLKLSGLAKETAEKEENAINVLDSLINSLPDERKKEGRKLQSDLDDLFELIKWNYMGYGANINEVLESYDLDWTPNKHQQLERQEVLCREKNSLD